MTVASPAPTVLVAGHVTLDEIGDELVPGGSVYYAGRAYLALGARVRAATAAAADFPADALAGIEAEIAPASRTTTFANSYGAGGRRAQRVDGTAPRLRPDRVPPSWLACDVLHLAPVIAEVDLGPWLRASRARFVGIGAQGWVRALAADGTVVQPRWEFEAADLAGVGAACIGEDDLPGQGDLVERLAAAVPVVAFTHGSRGCEVLRAGRRVHVGTYPTTEVDPTGAGDVFSAGFFLALAQGAAPVDAARLGAAAASIVVEAPGGKALCRLAEAPGRAAAIGVRR